MIAAACLGAGTDVTHLGEAEASGLVRIDANRVSFTHPLIRGVVYQEGEAAERRIAHAALAAALGDDDDRRVWHLAAAAIGTDEEVAAGLERVGSQAVARRAYAAGSGALERAAGLTPAGRLRPAVSSPRARPRPARARRIARSTCSARRPR